MSDLREQIVGLIEGSIEEVPPSERLAFEQISEMMKKVRPSKRMYFMVVDMQNPLAVADYEDKTFQKGVEVAQSDAHWTSDGRLFFYLGLQVDFATYDLWRKADRSQHLGRWKRFTSWLRSRFSKNAIV